MELPHLQRIEIDAKNILLVEDEYLIAHELKDYFVNMGAHIIGPIPSVEQALRHADYADAAVLDINIRGRPVFPVAERLLERSVPIVFFTGYEKNVVPARMSHICILSKPAGKSSVVEALMSSGLEGRVEPVMDDIPSLLPKLRLAARLLLADESAADRLIEGVLRDAIVGVHSRPSALSSERWLIKLLQSRAAKHGNSLLH